MGLGLEFENAIATPAPKPVYGEVISLFGLSVTNVIALSVSLQQTNTAPSFGLAMAYAIIATSITFGMVVILNAEAAEASSVKYYQKRKHAYERGSIMFTRLFVCAATLLAIVAGVMAFRIELPGQAFSKRIEVKLEKVAIYPFRDTKKDGLVVYVPFGKENYPNGVPAQINVEIVLDKTLTANWIVQEVVGVFNVPETREKMKYQPFLGDPDPKQPDTWPVLLEGLERNKEYQLKVYLYPQGKEQVASAQAAKALIDGRKAMRFFFNSPPK